LAGKEVVQDDRFVAAGTDADDADSGAAHVLNGTNVALRGGRQVAELAGAADVLIPAVEELVDRLRVVELGLRHRYFIHPGAVDVVRDAYRDPLPAGQRVEL